MLLAGSLVSFCYVLPADTAARGVLHSSSGRRKKKEKQRVSDTAAADDQEQEEADEAAAAAAIKPSLAPQVQFDPETGRIIIDDSTLTHVRLNPSNRGAYSLGRAVNEGESTVTSASYTNRTPAERWTPEQTRIFYKGLGIFGSDFSMIGKVLFHGKRDRRQVKNKFKREERENPAAIDAALNRRDPMPPPPPRDEPEAAPAVRDELDEALEDELGITIGGKKPEDVADVRLLLTVLVTFNSLSTHFQLTFCSR